MLARKVLILYASYGDGHKQVASALEQGLYEKGLRVVSVDLYAEAYPWINAITRFLYMKSYQWGSRIYGMSYYWTRDLSSLSAKARLLYSFGIQKLRKLIREEKPDAIINTFPISALAELRKRAVTEVPTFAVVTDFSYHDLWIHPEIDKYFVATEDLKAVMMSRGIGPEHIRVSGIPLRKTFCRPSDTESIMARWHLDPAKKTVLVMGGAYGVLHHVKEMAQALLASPDIQIMLVCGRNKRMHAKLAEEFAGEARIHVHGYVEQISELMSVSACIVTKAGGITLSEALAMNLPIVIFRPVPGQERENAAFLAAAGAAIVARQVGELAAAVERLVSEEGRMQEMQSAIRALHCEDSTQRIVAEIIEDLWRKLGPGL